jgi:hypothetical protein
VSEERFFAKVEKTDTCWLWTGAKNQDGYGRFRLDGRKVQAHRFAYELLVDPIPEGLELDHTCRVRHCVRPDHLEPVTHRENIVRGVGVGKWNARKTHCKHGHPFDAENTYINVRLNRRSCRACRNAHMTRKRAAA